MGRPPLGLRTILLRLKPEVIAQIRRIEKNVSAYVRAAVEKQLKKDLKKLDKPKD